VLLELKGWFSSECLKKISEKTQFFRTDQFDKNGRLSVHEVVEKKFRKQAFLFCSY